jgi:hypothetical protein
MPTVYFGTKDEPGFELEQSDDLIVVRTRSEYAGRTLTLKQGLKCTACPSGAADVPSLLARLRYGHLRTV